MVGRDLEERARRVYIAAAADVAVNHLDTGQLLDSLGYEVGILDGRLEARVGVAELDRTDSDVTNAEVCIFVHEGTERADGTVIPGDPFLRRALSAGR